MMASACTSKPEGWEEWSAARRRAWKRQQRIRSSSSRRLQIVKGEVSKLDAPASSPTLRRAATVTGTTQRRTPAAQEQGSSTPTTAKPQLSITNQTDAVSDIDTGGTAPDTPPPHAARLQRAKTTIPKAKYTFVRQPARTERPEVPPELQKPATPSRLRWSVSTDSAMTTLAAVLGCCVGVLWSVCVTDPSLAVDLAMALDPHCSWAAVPAPVVLAVLAAARACATLLRSSTPSPATQPKPTTDCDSLSTPRWLRVVQYGVKAKGWIDLLLPYLRDAGTFVAVSAMAGAVANLVRAAQAL